MGGWHRWRGPSHLSNDSIPAASVPNQNRRKACTQIHFRRGADVGKWVDGTAWREARKSHRSVTVAARQLGPGQVSRIAFVPGASHLSTDSISVASGKNQNRRKAFTQIHFRRGSDAEKWVDGTVGRGAREVVGPDTKTPPSS